MPFTHAAFSDQLNNQILLENLIYYHIEPNKITHINIKGTVHPPPPPPTKKKTKTKILNILLTLVSSKM